MFSLILDYIPSPCTLLALFSPSPPVPFHAPTFLEKVHSSLLIAKAVLTRDLNVVNAGKLLPLLPSNLVSRILVTTCHGNICGATGTQGTFAAIKAIAKLAFKFKVSPKELDAISQVLPRSLFMHIEAFICPSIRKPWESLFIGLAAASLGSLLVAAVVALYATRHAAAPPANSPPPVTSASASEPLAPVLWTSKECYGYPLSAAAPVTPTSASLAVILWTSKGRYGYPLSSVTVHKPKEHNATLASSRPTITVRKAPRWNCNLSPVALVTIAVLVSSPLPLTSLAPCLPYSFINITPILHHALPLQHIEISPISQVSPLTDHCVPIGPPMASEADRLCSQNTVGRLPLPPCQALVIWTSNGRLRLLDVHILPLAITLMERAILASFVDLRAFGEMVASYRLDLSTPTLPSEDFTKALVPWCPVRKDVSDLPESLRKQIRQALKVSRNIEFNRASAQSFTPRGISPISSTTPLQTTQSNATSNDNDATRLTTSQSITATTVLPMPALPALTIPATTIDREAVQLPAQKSSTMSPSTTQPNTSSADNDATTPELTTATTLPPTAALSVVTIPATTVGHDAVPPIHNMPTPPVQPVSTRVRRPFVGGFAGAMAAAVQQTTGVARTHATNGGHVYHEHNSSRARRRQESPTMRPPTEEARAPSRHSGRQWERGQAQDDLHRNSPHPSKMRGNYDTAKAWAARRAS